jgi:hypothetical protein
MPPGIVTDCQAALPVRSFRDPAVVMAQVLFHCEKIETLRCIEGITAVEQNNQ